MVSFLVSRITTQKAEVKIEEEPTDDLLVQINMAQQKLQLL
jgi:hypothetical protein